MTPEIKLKAKQAFADSYLFYLQAHYYHWNVEGRHFYQDHELLGKIYEEVYGSLDDFAEKIRSLDTYTPGVFNRFMDLSQIDQDARIIDAEEMHSKLMESNTKVMNVLTELFELLEDNKIYGFADFIGGRIDAHNKHQWMLRSTLK